MPSRWYGQGLGGVIDGTLDLITDTIKVMLVNDTYTYNADHDFADDVASTELNGVGYANGFGGSGRKTLASKTLTNDTANDRIEFDAADVTWTAINAGTIGGAVLVRETVNDAGSRIICFLDPSNLVTNGGDVTLVFDAQGIAQVSYAG
jgi:hypothetical protein